MKRVWYNVKIDIAKIGSHNPTLWKREPTSEGVCSTCDPPTMSHIVKESNVNCENRHQPPCKMQWRAFSPIVTCRQCHALHCIVNISTHCENQHRRDSAPLVTRRRLTSSIHLPSSQPPQLHTGGKPQQSQKQQLLRIRGPADDIYWSSKSDSWSGLLVLFRVECQRLFSGLKKPHEEITVTHKSPREILRLSDGLKSPIQKKSLWAGTT